jgi:hypothetical protein
MTAESIAKTFGDRGAGWVARCPVHENREPSHPHPFNAVIDMIMLSASSHLRDKARRPPFDTQRRGNNETRATSTPSAHRARLYPRRRR